MKGADQDFVKYTLRVGELVALASKHKDDSTNKHLFDGFQSSLDQINEARAGDHGPYLIEAAEEKLGKPNDIEIKKRDLGDNPISDPSEKWQTVDWAATSRAAQAKGISNVNKLITDFRSNWYGKNTKAREHFAVFRTYKRVGNVIKRWCR